MYNLAQLSFMNLLFTSELANIESWTQNWYSQEVDQRSNTHQADDIDWEVNPSWTDAHWVINLLRADTTSESSLKFFGIIRVKTSSVQWIKA